MSARLSTSHNAQGANRIGTLIVEAISRQTGRLSGDVPRGVRFRDQGIQLGGGFRHPRRFVQAARASTSPDVVVAVSNRV